MLLAAQKTIASSEYLKRCFSNAMPSFVPRKFQQGSRSKNITGQFPLVYDAKTRQELK